MSWEDAIMWREPDFLGPCVEPKEGEKAWGACVEEKDRKLMPKSVDAESQTGRLVDRVGGVQQLTHTSNYGPS